MAALTAQRVKTQSLGQPEDSPMQIGIAGTYTIYSGSIVMVNSSGYARPAATATGMFGAGVAMPNTLEGTNGSDKYNNGSGSDGSIDVRCSSGVFGPFENSGGGDAIADDDRGKVCYMVDDQTVALTSNAGARSPAGWVHKVDSAGVYVYFNLMLLRAAVGDANPSGVTFTQTYSTANATVAAATDAALTDSTGGSAGATLASGVGESTIAIPITLSSIAGAGDVLTNYTPGYKFKLLGVSFAVGVPVTTGGKAVDLNLEIGTTNVTGGVVSLTSANCTPLGALVAGTAITAANTGSASDTISIEAANVTAFVEGNGYLLINIQNMDTADAFASLEAKHVLGIADDLDNRQSINSLIDALQASGIVG